MVRKVISLTLMLIFLCHGASLVAGPHLTYAVGCGLRPRAAEERQNGHLAGSDEGIKKKLDRYFDMLADVKTTRRGSIIAFLEGYLLNAASDKWEETGLARKRKEELLKTFEELMSSDYFLKTHYASQVRKNFYRAVYYITKEILEKRSVEFIPILERFSDFAIPKNLWGDTLEDIRNHAGEEADPFRILSIVAAGPEVIGRTRFRTALNELHQIINFVEVVNTLRYGYGGKRTSLLAQAKGHAVVKKTGIGLRETFQRFLVTGETRKIGHRQFPKRVRSIMQDLGMELPKFILGEDVQPKAGSAFYAFREADLGDFLIFLCTAPYGFKLETRMEVENKVVIVLKNLMDMSEKDFNNWLNKQADWNLQVNEQMEKEYPELARLYQGEIRGKQCGTMTASVKKDFLRDIEVGLKPNPLCLSLTYGIFRRGLLLYALDTQVLFMKIIDAQEAKDKLIADCQIAVIPGQGAVVFPVYAKPGLVHDETRKDLLMLSALECLAKFAEQLKESLPHIAVVGNAELSMPYEEAIDLAQMLGHYAVSDNPGRLQKGEYLNVPCGYEGTSFRSARDEERGVMVTSFSTKVWATADTLHQAASDLREQLVREGVVFEPLPGKDMHPRPESLLESQVLRPQAAEER